MHSKPHTINDAHLAIMLRAAEEAGCRLTVSTTKPGALVGLCPFHDARRLESARTLLVETQRGRFTCHYCQSTGTPATFLAMLWETTVSDAHMLMAQHPGAGFDRPPYPDSYRERINGTGFLHRPLNAAVNTEAERFFHENLQTSYPALRLLAEMGIPPDKLLKKGIGFSTGRGLKARLLERGFDEADVDATPLTDSRTRTEWAGECITVADRDYSGGTSWFSAFVPEPKEQWTRALPKTQRLNGRRPELVNANNLGEGNRKVIITDDPRLYMMMRSVDLPVVMTAFKAPDRNDQAKFYRTGIAKTLLRKNIKQVSLLLVQGRALRLLSEQLLNMKPKVNLVRHTPQEAHQFLMEGLPAESELLPPRRTRPRRQEGTENTAGGGEKGDSNAPDPQEEPHTH